MEGKKGNSYGKDDLGYGKICTPKPVDI